jgi:putative endonuclease
MTNVRRAVFYVGITDNLVRRIVEHKFGFGSVFTAKYNLKYLIYFEQYQYIYDAINREKEIKNWRRSKKIKLIIDSNPHFNDLSEQLFIDYGYKEKDVVRLAEELRRFYKRDSSSPRGAAPRNDRRL